MVERMKKMQKLIYPISKMRNNILSLFLLILLLFLYISHPKAADSIPDSLHILYKEYQVADLQDINNTEHAIQYIYKCFTEGQVAAIRYHGILTQENVKNLISQVFFIDNPTQYDAEGMWGYMDHYNLSILSEPVTNITYIFVKLIYKYSMTDVQMTIDSWLTSAKQELEAEWHISTLSDREKAKAVHDYLIKKFDYDTSEQNTDDYAGIQTGKMVCQGYALLYCKLLTILDIECKIVLSDNHSWNVVKLSNTWYQVDVSGDDLGHIGIHAISHIHFLKKTLVGEKYNIIQPDIWFWNKTTFNNIYQPGKIIAYRILQVFLTLIIIVLVIFILYFIILLPISSVIHKKRKKIIKNFNDYISI